MRIDRAGRWESVNPILIESKCGLESGIRKAKIFTAYYGMIGHIFM